MVFYSTKSPTETQFIALKLAKLLRGGDLVLLKGDLGAGKTTFVQGIGQYFGISEQIQSPTFVLIKPYNIHKNSKNSKAKRLIHIDAYRTSSRDELEDLGINELISDTDNIVLVENPSNYFASFSKKKVVLLKSTHQNKRKISF